MPTYTNEDIKKIFDIKRGLGSAFIIMIIGLLGLLLSVSINTFCSYNATQIEDFKRTVSLNELLSDSAFGKFFIFFAIIMIFISAWFLSLKTKNYKKMLIIQFLFGFMSFILFVVLLIFIDKEITNYQIPNEAWSHLTLKKDIGYYIFEISIILCSTPLIAVPICLKLINNGKIKISDYHGDKIKTATMTHDIITNEAQNTTTAQDLITKEYNHDSDISNDIKVNKNKFCSECGALLSIDAKFCANCGHKVID